LVFDADAYLRKTPSEQEHAALELLRAAFRRAILEISSEKLMRALDDVRATGFRYQFSLRKLAMSHPSRKLRCEVLVTHRRGGTDAHLRAVSNTGTLLAEQELAVGKFWWPAVWGDFFRAKWVGDVYVIASRAGQETARLDARTLLAAQRAEVSPKP
jgi:hypothetical protein